MVKLTLTALIVGLLAVQAFAQSNQTAPLSDQTQLIVKGRVLDYEGRPVAGASVAAGPTGTLKGVLPMTRSNGEGEFAVVVHQTGQFFVTATKPTESYPSTGNLFYYPYPSTAALVTVLAGQPAPYATVQFGPRAGKMLMRIFDADTNEPIRTVTMRLCRIEAPKYCHRFTSDSARDIHSVLVPSVPFTIEVSAPGYESTYGENRLASRFQTFQVPADTSREMIIPMRKGMEDGRAELSAPKIVSPVDRTVLLNVAHPRMLTLEWAAVPGAATYTIEVEVCEWEPPDGGECKKGTYPLTRWRQPPPPTGIEGTKYEFMFPATQPGRWRVFAVDSEGRPGAKTPWTLFFYRWKE